MNSGLAYNRMMSQRQTKERFEKSQGQEQTFQFRNEALKDLWENELRGQISDGLWENTPNSGYIYWGNVKTEVAQTTQLTNAVGHSIKNNFQFTSLIQYVGDRMLKTIHKYEPNATEKDLRKYLNEIKSAMKNAKTLN